MFGQAATAWQVTIERDLTVEDIRNRPFKNKGTELLSNYTDDMLSVIRAYKRTAQMDDNTFYLFLVSNPEDPDRVGYFPLKRNAGFVFADRIPDMIGIYKTIAHELAHGAFRLQHPWEDRGASKTTQYFNLMDYTREGVHLHKYQWDLIHDPEPMLALWQDEDGAAAKSSFGLEEVSFSGTQDNFFTVVSDKGEIYNAPHFRKRTSKPVAYLRGSKMSISSKIEYNTLIDSDKELIIRLQLIDYNNGQKINTFIIPTDNVKLEEGKKKTFVMISDFEIDIKLPNFVRYFENFELFFDAVIKDKEKNIDEIEDKQWISIGSTKNDIYVLFDKPQPQCTLFESVLFMTCRSLKVQEADNLNSLLDGIWSLFNNSVENNNNLVIKKGESNSNKHVILKYYNPHNTMVTNAAMLLNSNGNGQCGAFSSLFIEMLLAHGYPYDEIKFVFYGLNKYWYEGQPCGFLVKDWTFSNTGTPRIIQGNISFTHTNAEPIANNNRHVFSKTEVSDTPGIPGQNSPNPASMFSNHQVVGIGNGENMVYYDPSYGKRYEGELEIRNSIDGVYYEEEDGSGAVPKYNYYIKKREAMNVLQIKLIPMTYTERLNLK